MKKALTQSLLTAEIASFAMLMLLFFLNTNKPYMLLVPIAGVLGAYFLFKLLVRRVKAAPLIIALPILLGILITVSVIGLLYFIKE